MKIPRQRPMIIMCCLGIGLASCAAYLLRPNLSPSFPVSDASRVSSTTLSSAQSVWPSRGGEPSQDWRTVPSGLFTAPFPDPLPPLPLAKPAAAHAPGLPAPLVPPLPVSDPLADYIYSGTVRVGDAISALIEHRGTKQGWYVQAGERWQAYDVVDVTEQAVTLLVEGQRHTLFKSGAMNLVPLVADADKGGGSGGANGLPQMAQAQPNGNWLTGVNEATDLANQLLQTMSTSTFTDALSAYHVMSSVGSTEVSVSMKDSGVVFLDVVNAKIHLLNSDS